MAVSSILVPTDFSPCADAAWRSAIDYAARHDAVLHLWHALEWPSAEGRTHPAEAALLADSRDRLDHRLSEAASREVRAIQHLTWSPFAEGLTELTAGQVMEAVFMGTHGVRGLPEWMYRSRTQRAVRTASCPVIAFKQAVEKPVRSVLFLTDLDPGALGTLDSVVQLFGDDNPTWHFLHVQLPRLFHESAIVLQDAEKRFSDRVELPHTWHDFPALSLERAIMTVRQTADIDVVALATRGQSPWQRAFRHSLAEGLVNHLDLPVCAVPIGAGDERVGTK